MEGIARDIVIGDKIAGRRLGVVHFPARFRLFPNMKRCHPNPTFLNDLVPATELSYNHHREAFSTDIRILQPEASDMLMRRHLQGAIPRILADKPLSVVLDWTS